MQIYVLSRRPRVGAVSPQTGTNIRHIYPFVGHGAQPGLLIVFVGRTAG
jgi:hypothetical protein